MTELNNKMNSVKNNMERLLRNHTIIKNENEIMKTQLLALRSALTEKNTLLKGLQQQLNTLKTAKSISEIRYPDDKSAVKHQINEFIKEIDKCIALLNN